RGAVLETGRRSRTAGALRDVFIHLAVFVRTGTETLDRSKNHLRIELLDTFPGEAHAIQRARSEVLDHHVALLDQALKHFLALLVLGVQGHGALVVVQHREVQAVHAGNVAQLRASRITYTGAFDLDHVSAEPGQKLSAARAGLHVGEIKNA